jgi:hypothetical protein
VAVVSSGPTCPHEGPDLSARTDNLAEWITSTISAEPGFFERAPVRLAGVVLFLLLAAVLIVRRRVPGPTPGSREREYVAG